MIRSCARAVAGVLALLAVSCTRQEPSPSPNAFFPLHDDDTWVYEVMRPLRNERTRMTVRVRGERYVPAVGQRARVVEETYASEAALHTLAAAPARHELYPILYYHKDGFLFRSQALEYQGRDLRNIGIGTTAERFLPVAFERGHTWDSEARAYDIGEGQEYVVRRHSRTEYEEEVVIVPAGCFANCLRVDTMATHGTSRAGAADDARVVLYYSDWYAPGVGLVRSIQANDPGALPPLAQIELLSYDVQHTEP